MALAAMDGAAQGGCYRGRARPLGSHRGGMPALSVDEFRAWERDIDRHGIHGLRATRLQIYRDTEEQKRHVIESAGP